MDRSNYLTYGNYHDYRKQLNNEHETFNKDHVKKCLNDIDDILSQDRYVFQFPWYCKNEVNNE